MVKMETQKTFFEIAKDKMLFFATIKSNKWNNLSEAKETALKECSMAFIDWMRDIRYKTFSRDMLLSLFDDCGLKTTAKYERVKQIITYLEHEGFIEKTTAPTLQSNIFNVSPFSFTSQNKDGKVTRCTLNTSKSFVRTTKLSFIEVFKIK